MSNFLQFFAKVLDSNVLLRKDALRGDRESSPRKAVNSVLCAKEKRLICFLFAYDYASQMPDLKLNTTQVGRFLVAGWMLERLLHPSIISNEKTVQCVFGETDTLVRLLKILGADAIVVDERQHISVNNDLTKFLHEIRG